LETIYAVLQSLRRTSLLLSSNKPHGPASVAKIGRWIEDQLKIAGIDTSIFTAHSTRGAEASIAVLSGVPIETIFDTGHWARESMFTQFYHREVANVQFCRTNFTKTIVKLGLFTKMKRETERPLTFFEVFL
jgi:hypothetical protein